jgi:hypothetical protein
MQEQGLLGVPGVVHQLPQKPSADIRGRRRSGNDVSDDIQDLSAK